MANYGRMYDRSRRGMRGYGSEFTRRGFGTLGYGAAYRSPRGAGYGGMRSDQFGRWDRYEGEGGWLGEATEGYPGGEWSEAEAINRARGREGRGYAQRGYGGAGYGNIGYGGAGYGREYGRRGGSRDHLSRTRAADIMTDNPETVTPDTPVSDVAKKMRELDVGIIPVVESDENRRLRGVITDRDLAVRVLAEGRDGKVKVSECMSGDLRTVNKNDSVRDVLDVMRSEQVRRVPVTDREGRLVGIIAQADLAVDFATSERDEVAVEDTIERISEPARPRR